MKNLLNKLSELNVRVELRDGKLHVNAPSGVLTPELQTQIREHKAALTAMLGNSWEEHSQELPEIAPEPQKRHEPFPLNDVQHAYWIGRQAHFDLGNVSTHFYFELDCEDVDIALLSDAFNKVVAHHDMMRAVTDEDGMQRILAEVPRYEIAERRLDGLTAAQQHAAILECREDMSARQIASDRWPLFEIRAARLDERRARLFLSWDFIFLDAWSLLLIFKQWHHLYLDSADTLAPLTLSFRDYVLAEERLKQHPTYRRAKDYWIDRIDALPLAPMLPVVSKNDGTQRQEFSRRRFTLPAEKWSALKDAARKSGLTPSSVLLAGFAEVLNRWSKSQHYCLNLTVFNRRPVHAEVAELVGDFTNLMVLEVDGRTGATFAERAQSVQEQFLRDFDHREFSAIEVLREMAKRRGSQQRVLLPVVFTSTLMLDGGRSDDSAGLERFGKMAWGISQTPQVWLDYQIFESNGELIFNWDGVDDVFLPGVLDDMFEANRRLIEALAGDPTVWQRDEVVALPAAQEAVRRAVNDTAAEPAGACIHQAFIDTALRHPERIAIVCGNKQIRYGELLAHSNALAQQLLERGAAPNRLVAVIMEKGWEQLVAVLAILISGAAYLPIDARWPSKRRAGILERTEATIVLTQPALAADMASHDNVDLIIIEAGGQWPALTAPPVLRQTLQDLAYVIFTSGSTGEPKGVMIDHRGAATTLVHVNRLFHVGVDDKVLAVSELGFDLSVFDIFGLLAVGGTVVIPAAEASRDPGLWLDLIREHRISIWNSAPQLMNLLVEHAEAAAVQGTDRLSPLRLVMMSGDWIPTRLPGRIKTLAPQCHVVSLGGATEGSIWSIYFPVETVDPAWDSIPYGKALPNQHMYVLNKRMQNCPDLVVGDIYIGGDGVALGYWRDEEKTRQRFINHPRSGEKLYWTGDLGSYLPDGNIKFLGREDTQVKLRGYRVELGEIAASLQSHPAIREAAVQVLKRDGRDTLVAYIVEEKREDTSVDGTSVAQEVRNAQLARYLSERLPEYMLPQKYVTLDEFPLSTNGKLDFSALPKEALAELRETRIILPPKSALQSAILKIWQEVLGTTDIGTNDNFFEAGGDSMLLTTVLRRLNSESAHKLTMPELFTYPTVEALAQYIDGQDQPSPGTDLPAVPSTPAQVQTSRDIAIIGMAGRFPDADNPDELWDNLAAGRCSVRHFSDEELLRSGVTREELQAANYVKAGPVLAGLDQFDAAYFGIPPSEAEFMDPQQRFLLECAQEALENAGYASEKHAGRIGVFAGKGAPRYMIHHVLGRPDIVEKIGMFTTLLAHDKDHAATLVSYKLNLTGPSLSINTTCSTSLVTVHAACQSLMNGDCEVALAGGVSFMSTREKSGYLYEEGQIMSPDGYCRAFSDDANGVVFGSGVGMVVLKPLAAALRDRDSIHAVIKGIAINNDGAVKVGYTAPSLEGQSKVIAAAQRQAGVTPDMVQYVEAHGTGTNLGDPIEVGALRKIFGGTRAAGQQIALGSIKSNIGHLDTAAGVTSLIKVVQSLKNKKLPPTVNISKPNTKIEFSDSPFYLNTELRDWPAGASPRLAGVSSFGVGGTNVHAIIEEAPVLQKAGSEEGPQVLVLSAKTRDGLHRLALDTAGFLEQAAEAKLTDVAYTLQLGRNAHRYRTHLGCSSKDEAAAALRKQAAHEYAECIDGRRTNIVFLFPGQGAQKTGATRELYQAGGAFKTAMDECADLVMSYIGIDIRTLLYEAGSHGNGDGDASIDQTAYTQPLLFSMEYALAQHWFSLGIKPLAMLGHSLGEYVAACLAGVFSLEEALSLVVVRGQLIQNLPHGAMLAVNCSEAEIAGVLPGSRCCLAAVNGPKQCVVSGPKEALASLSGRLDGQEIPWRILKNSHAFHSSMMDPIIETYQECVEQVQRDKPKIPFISCVTGDWISDEQATSAHYWGRHLRETVRFADGVNAVKAIGNCTLLEVGPGHTLATLARASHVAPQDIVSSLEKEGATSEMHAMQSAAGRLWERGADIHWQVLHAGSTHGRIALPTYPFERQRYWIEYGGAPIGLSPRQATDFHSAPTRETAESSAEKPILGEAALQSMRAAAHARPALQSAFVAPVNEIEITLAGLWQEYLGIESIGVNDNFFDLGGDSLMATRIYSQIRKRFDVELPKEKLFELATIKRLYLFIAASRDINVVETLTEEELNEFQAVIES